MKYFLLILAITLLTFGTGLIFLFRKKQRIIGFIFIGCALAFSILIFLGLFDAFIDLIICDVDQYCNHDYLKLFDIF